MTTGRINQVTTVRPRVPRHTEATTTFALRNGVDSYSECHWLGNPMRQSDRVITTAQQAEASQLQRAAGHLLREAPLSLS